MSVDLRKAKVEDKDMQARTATIVLPPPELLNPRVDHDKTREYDFSTGLFRSPQYAGELRSRAMQEAQHLVTFAAQDEVKDASSIARQQAQAVIRNFYLLVGWDVKIRWADQLSAQSAPIN